jgi:UPF0042 nucleotide-binding protein
MNEAAPRIVWVAGLSGSGKSTAMAALEDLAFYCVDNLPPQLLHQFLDLCAKATPPIEKIALAIDTREEPFLRGFPGAVAELRQAGVRLQGIFLDCADEVLVSRYRETRRVHPLAPAGRVAEGIARERRLLGDVARLADLAIDTTRLNIHQLKETVVQHVAGETRATVVNLVSFGFRYGSPREAELLFDLRFLPNPYFEPALRDRTGADPAVAEYVIASGRGAQLFDRLLDLLDFLLPLYDAEGKAYLTIAVGCTGGRHRSVAVVNALAERLRGSGREINVEHRDVHRDAVRESGERGS